MLLRKLLGELGKACYALGKGRPSLGMGHSQLEEYSLILCLAVNGRVVVGYGSVLWLLREGPVPLWRQSSCQCKRMSHGGRAARTDDVPFSTAVGAVPNTIHSCT